VIGKGARTERFSLSLPKNLIEIVNLETCVLITNISTNIFLTEKLRYLEKNLIRFGLNGDLNSIPFGTFPNH